MISGGEDKPGRNHAISTQLRSWPGDPARTLVLRVAGLPAVRRRRAGRPQRSEDRTGPASERSGRRPLLTRERKILTLDARQRRQRLSDSD